MTLAGPTASWHAKHLLGSFATFEALKTKLLRLFHRQVEQRELVCQFYTTYQEEQETVPQFIIRFQSGVSGRPTGTPQNDVHGIGFPDQHNGSGHRPSAGN